MYNRTYSSNLGCSVTELVGRGITYQYLIKLYQNGGITLCVTGSNYEAEESVLKKAGFVVLLKYKNYNGHHGTECKLWCKFSEKNCATRPRTKAKALKKVALPKIERSYRGARNRVAPKKVHTVPLRVLGDKRTLLTAVKAVKKKVHKK